MPSRKRPQTRRTNQGSRTCKPNSVHGIAPAGRPFLWAAHHCSALATYPKVRRTGPARVRGRSRVLPSYLVLLRVGFALPAALLRRRCALTAPFHPYPGVAAGAVCFLWHFPSSGLESTLPDVIRHTALRSSDFPPPLTRSLGYPAFEWRQRSSGPPAYISIIDGFDEARTAGIGTWD